MGLWRLQGGNFTEWQYPVRPGGAMAIKRFENIAVKQDRPRELMRRVRVKSEK
jgi:hypothetical protein